MQQSFVTKDILNVIFNFCDIKTKFAIKILCNLTYHSYQIVRDSPIKHNTTTKFVVMYNDVKVCSFLLEYYNVIPKHVILKYSKIIMDKYNLDPTSIVEFNIIGNNKTNKCTVDNKKVTVKVTKPMGLFRKFKIIVDGKERGHFLGQTPKQASRKAFQSLVKLYRKKNKNFDVYKVDFTIKETTKSSKRSYYYYTGISTTLPVPTLVQIRGNMIAYKVENNVKERAPQYISTIKD